MDKFQRSDATQVSRTYTQLMQALTPANRAAERLATAQTDVLGRSCDVLHGLPEIYDPTIKQDLKGKIILISGALDVAALGQPLLEMIREANAVIVPSDRVTAPNYENIDVPIFYKTSLASWSDVNWLLMCLSQTAEAQPDDLEPSLLNELITLADKLSAETDCTITIEDPQSRIIAYSSMQDTEDVIRIQSILQRQVPAERLNELQKAGFFERVWESDVPVDRPHVDGRPERLVMGVSHNGLPLGMLWAASGEKNVFTESTREALRRCAVEVAPLLMRWTHQTTALSHMRDRAVEALFTSLDDSVRAQSVLDIDPSSAYVTMKAFQHQSGSDALPELVQFYIERFFPQAIGYALREQPDMYIAVEPDELGLEGIRQVARKLVHEVRAHVSDVKIAIGASSSSPGKIYLSALSADRVQSSLRRSSARSITGLSVVDETHLAESLEVESLLEGIDRSSSAIAQLLDPLHEHDTVHGSELVTTLSKYFEHFGNVSNAARSINIHVNTMRYRIKKIRRLVRLDLTDLDTLIAWAVAVRFDQR